MHRIIILAVAIFASTFTNAESVAFDEGLVLTPMSACTEMGCPDEDTCCNSCTVLSWEVGVDTPVRFATKAPEVKVDGCGRIVAVGALQGAEHGYYIVVDGRWIDGAFEVSNWRVFEDHLAHTSRATQS